MATIMTADRIVIRDAEAQDLDEIRDLLGELRAAIGAASRLERGRMEGIFEAMRADPAHYRNLVACDGGKIVAFVSSVSYLGLLHGEGDRSAFINELVVAASHRNRGIGSDLVRELARRMRMQRREGLEVGTQRSNKGAIRFYRRAGFKLEYRLFGMQFDGCISATGPKPAA